MLTLKVLGALLTYPDAALIEALDEMESAIEGEGLVQPHRLARLFARMRATPLLDLQEDYVGLFDRSRALSLHVFEHVHGESRDRGQAMVDLTDLYRKHGLEIAAHELPDYLPMFLEFLSLLPLEEAKDILSEPAHVLAALKERLDARASLYADVFAALIDLIGETGEGEIVTAVEDDSLDALDRQWEEEQVTFTATPDPSGGARCPAQNAARNLAAMIEKGV